MSTRGRGRQATLFEAEVDGPVAVEEPPLELPLALAAADPPAASEPATAPRGAVAASRGARVRAGLADLGVHCLVAASALGGAALLGVAPSLGQLPGLAVLMLVFSLFYTVVPLAFWGRTAGMALAGIVCRGEDGQPLAFAEAARRWLGSLATALLLGLPALLLPATGRTLADRWSGRVPLRG